MKVSWIFFVLLVLVSPMQLSAQRKSLSPGIRAGINVATLSNVNADYRTDFYVGGILGFNLTERYTLQPEITYSRQGGNNVEMVEEGSTSTGNISLEYLSIGVANKLHFAGGFHALLAPSIDVKIGKNFPLISFADDDNEGIDLGLSLGLGYTLPMGLTVEGRFKTGLLNALNNNYFLGLFESNNDVSLNRVFQIGVAYTF